MSLVFQNIDPLPPLRPASAQYTCILILRSTTQQEYCTAMVHYFVTYALFLQEVFLQEVLNFVTLSEIIMLIYGFTFSFEFFVLKR
jgi:hypothetical protein